MDFTELISALAAGRYLEDYERQHYLWRNYRHALSSRQQALHRAATLELKARHASTDTAAASLRAMVGYFFDAEVDAITATGLAAYERICVERLEAAHAAELFVNRCERCGRIVASPVACTCLWCGHHWYERRAEMRARAASSLYPPPRRTTPST